MERFTKEEPAVISRCYNETNGTTTRFGVSLTPSEVSAIVKPGRWSTPSFSSPQYGWPGPYSSSLVKGGFEGS